MLLATVQRACHASITFRFRVTLKPKPQSYRLERTSVGVLTHRTAPLDGAAGSSMSMVSENTMLLGTIRGDDVAIFRVVHRPGRIDHIPTDRVFQPAVLKRGCA